MPRKRKTRSRKPTDKSLINVNATLRKLQSQLTDPRVYQWLFTGARGVRERLLKIDYEVLRNVVDKIPLVNGIINTRIDQINPFCQFTMENGEKGFKFIVADRSGKENPDDNEMFQLAEFIEQTGFQYDPEREDDFMDYVQMIIRDTMVIDQIATEMQFNRVGEVVAFWSLDGATIKRVTEESDFKRGIRFVQEIEQKIYNEYTADQLIFDYKNKRVDIRYRGYGYSNVEMCVDMITTLLFGYNYLRDQLVRDRIPKGFISVMGDASKPQMDAIRNYWYAAMSGAGGAWNIPILPSGKEGVGIDFKLIGHNNRDMEYHKMMMFLSSIVAAVFSIDLAEMGIKTDDSTAIIGENAAPRLQMSKDRGLKSLLTYVQQHINKVLRKVTTKYKLKFVGYEPEDEEKKAGIRIKELNTCKTINELRQEDGLDPIEDDYANVVLNPQAVQIYLGKQGGGFGGGFGGGTENQEGEAEGKEEFTGEESEGEIEKSFRELSNRKERTIRYVIE